jgi:hypothetical protein
MKIAGVSMVRNAADLIAVSALHHLHSGLDVLYVVDNASTDGTDAVLARVARELPVKWLRDDGPFNQGGVMTELARTASREGADWIIPIDADEFWWTAGGDLRRELASLSSAAVECSVVQFVQRRDVWFACPEGLLSMTRRVNEPVGTCVEAPSLVTQGKIAFVEIDFATKWIVRASATLEIPRGSHRLVGVDGDRTRSETIQCLHAPLRAKSIFGDRVSHADRLEVVESNPAIAWQSRWWKRRAESDELDVEWNANSYAGNSLDVNGVRRPLVIDLRLRNCAARWIDHELVQWSAATLNAGDDPISEQLLAAEHAVFHSTSTRTISATTEQPSEVAAPGDPASSETQANDLQPRDVDTTAGSIDAARTSTNDLTMERAANAELLAQLERSNALLHVTKERLDSALEMIADRDVVISDLDARLKRISRSVLGRWYLAVARKPFLRRLIRSVTALD